MDSVKKHITRATELTAIAVSRLIKEKGFSPTDILDEEENINRERLIDQTGADAMYTALSDIPFVLEVVGSEGRKHIHQYGEALPTLEGVFGKGELKLDCVNDVVEGSKAAKLNTSGAVSVVAVGPKRGLMATPSDIDYMDKLFGPPQLKGKMSMLKSPEENLDEVVGTFSIKPSEITVVMMDRERNARYINACKKFGVNLILIKAGDFMPSILSFMDPEKSLNDSSSKHAKGGIYLIMGSGGFEEGVMAAVAGKALGAFVEARGWSADEEISKRYEQVWSVDDLVPGNVDHLLVSISAITNEDRWFDLKGVSVKSEGESEVTTLTVDKMGVNIKKVIHH